VTPELQLRDYQKEAIAELHSRWDAGATRVPMVLATGLGKTVIFTHPTLVDRFLDAGKRVLVLAHTDELIEQAARKARAANPGRRVGIVKAQQNEVHAEIIISSRQTLASQKRRDAIRNVGLVVVDEAHHALRTNTYGRILEHFGAWPETAPSDLCLYRDDECERGACCRSREPRVKVAGFTATLARGDKNKLSTVWETGDGKDGHPPVFRRDILFGIRRGYLLDVVGERVVVPDLDMSKVRQTAGDYRDTDLAEELERTFAPQVVAEAYAKSAGRRKGIAFWPLVETAEHGAEAFNAAGIRSEVIHGKLPKDVRRAMLRRLHTGETQVVHGVGVLTEGFDEPTVDVVVIARPTRSAPLYQQMVGRVLRPDLTKPPAERGKALILDVVGAGAKHDLRSLVDLSPERPLRQDEDESLSLLELDEELLLLEEEQRREGGTLTFEGAEDYRGPVDTVAFDPLGRDQLWARTPGGTWYMGAGGDAYVFLTDSIEGDPGTYDVVLCSKTSWGAEVWARGTEHVQLPLDMALGWAEEVAMEVGGLGTKTLTGRKSAWRKKPADEYPKSMAHARRLGIVVPVGEDGRATVTAGEVSELIDAEYARRRIDPLVARVKGASA
jgi:superfamily II DNA or RNA helicase